MRLQNGIKFLLLACAILSCKPLRKAELDSDLSGTSSSRDVRAVFELMSPASIRQEVIDQYQRLKISTGIKVFEIDSIDAAKLTGAYRYAVRMESSGVHLRQDVWRLSGALSPGAILTNGASDTLPIMLNFDVGREVRFSRRFPNKESAISALPRTPIQMPLTPEKALALAPGEIVSLPLNMGIAAGLSYGTQGPLYGAGASTGVFWKGTFALEISRIEGSWVRVRVTPAEKKGYFYNSFIGLKTNYFGYGPFGLVNFDKIAAKELGLDIFRLSGETGTRGSSTTYDYAYQLADINARRAYEALLAKTLRLTSSAIAAARGEDAGLSGTAFISFDLSEQIAREDQTLPLSRKRVHRIGLGDHSFGEEMLRSHFGTKLLRYSKGISLTLNRLRILDSSNRQYQFFYNQYSSDSSQKSLYSPLKESDALSVTSIFSADESWQNHRFVDFIFSWNRKDKLQLSQEQSDYRGSVEAIFGRDHQATRSVASTGPVESFTGNLQMVFQGDLFSELWQEARRDRAAFEESLVSAAEAIAARFDNRFGIGTPGQAIDWRNYVKNTFSNGWNQMRQSLRNAISLRWGSAAAQAMDQIITNTARLGSDNELDIFSDYLKILHDYPAANELLPAYFLELATAKRLQPYVSLTTLDRDRVLSEISLGENPRADTHAALQATYRYLREIP